MELLAYVGLGRLNVREDTLLLCPYWSPEFAFHSTCASWWTEHVWLSLSRGFSRFPLPPFVLTSSSEDRTLRPAFLVTSLTISGAIGRRPLQEQFPNRQLIRTSEQRRFFRGGKGRQASLTFLQSTNKIIAVFIPDFMSYMKMSRLIKQKFFVSLLQTESASATGQIRNLS